METTEAGKKQRRQEIKEFLREKKARDGKLSKIGEWVLSGKSSELGLYVKPENMKYILR